MSPMFFKIYKPSSEITSEKLLPNISAKPYQLRLLYPKGIQSSAC